MDGRKGKRKKEHDETKESSRESTGSTAAGTRGGGASAASAGASGGAPPTRGNPAENSGSAAPAADEPRGRSSPTGQPAATAPKGSAPRRHGVRSPRVRGQAKSSGIMPPPAMASTAAATARGGGTSAAASAGASGTPPATRGNPGQNTPRSAAPVADEPCGLSWTKAQLRAAALGLSAPRDGVHSPGVQGQAQSSGSGTRSPPAKACPVCHHSVFSNTICVNCACVDARKLVLATRPPPPLQAPQGQQQQQRPDGIHQGHLSPAYLEFVANRLMGQPRGLAPVPPSPAAPPPVPAISIPPQPQDQRPPRPPQQHPRPPQPIPAGAQLQHQRLRHMAAELAAARRAAAERGEAPRAGAPSAAKLGLPGVQRLPKAQPVPREDKPVGFHYNPVVLGPGPDPEDGWCPACRFYPARTVLQPRQHDCVCQTCRDVDRIVCPVCGSK